MIRLGSLVLIVVLAVVARSDDETFGLGAVIDAMASAGSALHALCFTSGETSTLNESGADLRTARAAELRHASAELGRAFTPHDFPDAGLPAVPQAELEAAVARLRPGMGRRAAGIRRHRRDRPRRPYGRNCRVRAATSAGLPVLAWTIPAAIASQLRAGTGAHSQVGQSTRWSSASGSAASGAARGLAARQPGLTGSGAVASAAAARCLRAPALDHRAAAKECGRS